MRVGAVAGTARWQDIPPRDLLLPALFGAAATVELVLQGYRSLWAGLTTYWLAVLALGGRRRFPLATTLLVAAVYAVTPLLGFDVSQPASWVLPPALACFATGLYVSRLRAPLGLATVVAAVGILFATLQWLTDFNADILFGLLFTVGPWMLGVALREAQDRAGEHAVDAERARAEAAQAAASAAARERERIARELHDVLAHSLSVIVVQASVAEDVLARNTSSDAAIAAIREVQQLGRDALGECGRLLRLIRDDDDELGMRPQYDVADLPTLADEYVRAGLDVDLAVDAAAGTLPLGVGISAYRIVQEALTNALKHAPGSHVSVHVERSGDALSLEVVNGPGHEPTVHVESGHGLSGIRERVALFGGTLRAGPTDGGGFRLAATLPMLRDTS